MLELSFSGWGTCEMTFSALQPLKSWVRKFLEKHPYGMKLVSLLRSHLPGGTINKHRAEKREAARILRGLREGKIKTALIVYDNLVSPPTYGDYLYVLMLARFFTSQDIYASVVIVDREYRHDWSVVNEDDRDGFVADYVNIASLLLDPALATVEVLTSPQLQARIRSGLDNGAYVPFRENVINRRPIYCHAVNTLNRLCFESSPGHLDRFLLSFDELAGKVELKKPAQPYITWSCRYSTKWGFRRNTSDEEFLPLYRRLKSLYPHHAIMVVSDAVGCNHFKEIARLHGLNCLFSKDYSDTLMGDGALILGSAYFFMLRGGGISYFPMFSRVPYELVIYLGNETEWRNGRLFSWASGSQIFRLADQTENPWPTLGATSAQSEWAGSANQI